jgi:hypothetical protein
MALAAKKESAPWGNIMALAESHAYRVDNNCYSFVHLNNEFT